MNCSEYENIKHFTYGEYCDYLQMKHSIGKYDFMTKSWNKNIKCTRTNEGLIAHHKYENCAIMLSKKEIAMSNGISHCAAGPLVRSSYHADEQVSAAKANVHA